MHRLLDPIARPMPLAGRARSFGRDREGAVALLFGLLVVPLVFIAGVAVDYSRATELKVQIASAADRATLAAANAVKAQLQAGKSFSVAQAYGQSQAILAYNASLPAGTSSTQPVVTIVQQGSKVTVELSHTAQSPNAFARIFNMDYIEVSARAKASTLLKPYVDVALLIDVSGSMAIGADSAAVETLKTQLGCAFACHDGNPVKGTTMDAYQWAVANGILLRTQAVNNGIVEFLDYLKTDDPAQVRNRVALFGFSDALTLLVNYTTNLDSAKANLPKQTNAASEYTGATHFAENMPSFTTQVGTAGDGSTSTSPKKLVVIATDGIQDPNRTWTTNVPLRAQVAPFNPAACSALKAAGVSVGIIHTPYVPMTWDWGYNATVGAPSLIGGSGTRNDDIAPQLKACASSSDLYTVASSTDVGSAFKTIFQSFSQTKLDN